MKSTNKALIALLALGTSASLLMAQDAGGPPDGGQRPPRQNRQGGPRMNGQRPVPPVMHVLDANHDGEIDATEIANASAALKTLDKNGDGKLTQDELRPPRPDRGGDRQGPPPGDE